MWIRKWISDEKTTILDYQIKYPTLKFWNELWEFEFSEEYNAWYFVPENAVYNTNQPYTAEFIWLKENAETTIEWWMKIYGVNSTEELSSLKQIWSKDINNFEKYLTKSEYFGHHTDFITQTDSLLDILIKDNKEVVDKYWLTHQKVARPLEYILKLYKATRVWYHQPKKFKHENWEVYTIEVVQYASSWADITITKDNWEQLYFHSSMADSIAKLWLYWWSTKKRIEPHTIIDFFGL